MFFLRRRSSTGSDPDYYTDWITELTADPSNDVTVEPVQQTLTFRAYAGDRFDPPVVIAVLAEDLNAYVSGLIGRDGTVYGRWPRDERREKRPAAEAAALFRIHFDEFIDDFAQGGEVTGPGPWKLDAKRFIVEQ